MIFSFFFFFFGFVLPRLPMIRGQVQKMTEIANREERRLKRYTERTRMKDDFFFLLVLPRIQIIRRQVQKMTEIGDIMISRGEKKLNDLKILEAIKLYLLK